MGSSWSRRSSCRWGAHVVLMMAGLSVYLERKISAYIQDRLGPNRTGLNLGLPFLWFLKGLAGIGQALADGLKFFLKEDYTPPRADKVLFTLAPVFAVIPALLGFVIIPWGGYWSMPEITLPLVGTVGGRGGGRHGRGCERGGDLPARGGVGGGVRRDAGGVGVEQQVLHARRAPLDGADDQLRDPAGDRAAVRAAGRGLVRARRTSSSTRRARVADAGDAAAGGPVLHLRSARRGEPGAVRQRRGGAGAGGGVPHGVLVDALRAFPALGVRAPVDGQRVLLAAVPRGATTCRWWARR